MRSILIAAVTMFVPALAHADQCALVDAKVAEAARARIQASSRALEFCEPCGDRVPKKSFAINSVSVRNNSEVILNGSAVDLAYLYVETSKTAYKNVGIAVGCGAENVSELIRGGKPSGPTAGTKTPIKTPARPPLPPMARATAPDDLAGRWIVRVTTFLSSCPASPSRPDEVWDISLVNGKFTISTSASQTYEGAAATLTHGMFQHSLNTSRQPSATVVKLTHSLRDRFYGTIVRADATHKGNHDPICVVQYSISGTRVVP